MTCRQSVEKMFMEKPITLKERVCIIFHCEFSSHRGPTLYVMSLSTIQWYRERCLILTIIHRCQFLRSWDRKIHELCYPELYYPELYVLEGGYKKFFETPDALEFCDPPRYLPMKDKRFISEMKSGTYRVTNNSKHKQYCS